MDIIVPYFVHRGSYKSTTLAIVFFTITQSWQCWHYCQLCIPTNLQFSSLFASTVVRKCEIRNQGVHEDYISRLHAYWNNQFLLAELKRSWQCWHSCIA